MEPYSEWDFRSNEDIVISNEFESRGYVILDSDWQIFEEFRVSIIDSLKDYLHKSGLSSEGYDDIDILNYTHKLVPLTKQNEMRLFIMNKMHSLPKNNFLIYRLARRGVDALCGNELVMQRRISLSVQYPDNIDDVLPIHADTWNGVSAYDISVWIPLVDCVQTMGLYIVNKESFKLLVEGDKMVFDTPDKIFTILEKDLKFLEARSGEVVCFDHSIPHGFALNEEKCTQWSINCRFKNVHSPYSDKLLGEYYIPITLRSASRIGMSYEPPF